MELSSIQKRLDLIEQYAAEIRTAREMLKGELENSPEYMELHEEVKAATAKRKQAKEKIMNQGPNQKLSEEIKHNTEEIKTLREILSAELFEVYKNENVEEITDSNGETRKFKVEVKLLPKRGYQD
jgi:hypothetical protein